MPPDTYFIERTDERLKSIESKLDTLVEFRVKTIAESRIVSFIVSSICGFISLIASSVITYLITIKLSSQH